MEGKLNLPINVITRHIVECQLRELKGGTLPASHQPPFLCLQMLCSMVPSTQLSHNTIQLVRYSTLLHNAKKLKDGELNEQILANILDILVAITEAPELKMEFLQSALGSLLVDTDAGCIRGGVDKYWKKVVSFIETVLQFYGISPEVEKSLSTDAYQPSPKGRRTRRNPGKDCAVSPSKQQKLVEDLVPYVVVVNSSTDGSYSTDISDIPDVQINEPTPLPLPPKLADGQEDLILNIPSLSEVRAIGQGNHTFSPGGVSSDTLAAPVDHSCAAAASTQNSVVVKSSVGGTPAIDHHENSGNQGSRGIFKGARAATSDMEWTSDESDCIGPSESMEHSFEQRIFTLPPKLSQSPGGTPKTSRRKWTEEEHACLLEGVRVLGEGKWKEIKNMYHDVLKDRAAIHLKDRYRNTEGKRGKKKDANLIVKT